MLYEGFDCAHAAAVVLNMHEAKCSLLIVGNCCFVHYFNCK